MTQSPIARKRVASNRNLDRRRRTDQHLRALSVKDQLRRSHSAQLPDYLFDPVLGQGSTIYVIDGGFNIAHGEFSSRGNGRSVDTLIAPNDFTLAPINGVPDKNDWAGENDITDHNGHGTAVASVAGGVTHGVASRANLVLVKFRNAAINPDSGRNILRGVTEPALLWAWQAVLNDITQKKARGHAGVFIINMSYGFIVKDSERQPGPLASSKSRIMQRVLAEAEALDVIVVIAAGNENILHTLDEITPQEYGRPDNSLITVGSATANGFYDDSTTRDAGHGGSITVYGVGKEVVVADWRTRTGSRTDDGTSLASLAIAGLAAYFGSLRSLAGDFPTGSVPMAMKNYITRYAYKRAQDPIAATLQNRPFLLPPGSDSVVVAYNRAPDGLCSAQAPSKRHEEDYVALARRQIDADVPIVVSGSLVASDIIDMSLSYCPATSGIALTTSPTGPTITTNSPTSSSSAILSATIHTLNSTLVVPGGPATFTTSTVLRSNISSPSAHLSSTASRDISTVVLPSLTTLGPSVVPGSTNTVIVTNTIAPPPPAPTIDTDDGILTCGTRTDTDNAVFWFTLGDAEHAVNAFCTNLTSNDPAIILEPGSTVNLAGTYDPPDNVNNPIRLSVKWGTLGSDAACPTFDMSKNADNEMGSMCQDRLYNAVNDCDTVDPPQLLGNSPAGEEFWKQGGGFFRDCITWEITSNNNSE